MTLRPANTPGAASSTRDLETHRVDEALVEAIALRTAELVLEAIQAPAAPSSESLWSPADVARELGMSADWVRDHRDELGVITTTGVRPRLWFDPARVREWATAREGVVRSRAPEPASTLGSRRARRSGMGTGVDLLPVAGDRRAA